MLSSLHSVAGGLFATAGVPNVGGVTYHRGDAGALEPLLVPLPSRVAVAHSLLAADVCCASSSTTADNHDNEREVNTPTYRAINRLQLDRYNDGTTEYSILLIITSLLGVWFTPPPPHERQGNKARKLPQQP